mmetsp:Transcript_8344/g.13518  ORF Transcript_8344/g.13518 Transcript_8344/m.13518 type:complete len:296 (+) Transcript_8344:190-1077(+)|eukprot:CAMPEP_0203760464 /NCGR_PEP_ID=MMETSP0098-20131031/13749_1 /ASSEMBLY_ACC=CAM_ASM_000208 /TAXON_ID=96639 /ORGANISM=" , Strain NY0313808BC1" /LENGTH=295 /DNA_ID=CAMNT_0050654031 /DNA_START=1842 /DNA_END=2729 /DNA_ORIENTATION=+
MDDDDAWASMFARASGKVDDDEIGKVIAAGQDDAADEVDDEDVAGQGRQVEADLDVLDRWLEIGGKGGKDWEGAMFDGLLHARDEISGLYKSRSNKLVKVENVFPVEVARALLACMKRASTTSWDTSSAQTDTGKLTEGAGTTSHRYDVGCGSSNQTEDGGRLSKIIEIMGGILPKTACAFQAARYTKGHFIEPHNDVAMKSFNGNLQHREVAVIIYLSQNWKVANGGLFVDHSTGLEHVPKFNSLVAFRVPRMHEVSLMKTTRARFSLFGWFYKLNNQNKRKRGHKSGGRRKKR